MKVTLDAHTIQIVNLFQNMTGTSVIDCIPESDEIYFVVAKGQYGLAIGKNGSRIRLAEKVFKKSIKIFEYSSDLDEFIKNVTGDSEIKKMEKGNGLLIIDVQQGNRARIIGKNGKNIKVINRFLERLFNINMKVR
jgi:N utilization substance protein A